MVLHQYFFQPVMQAVMRQVLMALRPANYKMLMILMRWPLVMSLSLAKVAIIPQKYINHCVIAAGQDIGLMRQVR